MQIVEIIVYIMRRKIRRERKRVDKKVLRYNKSVERLLNWVNSIGCTGATGKDEYV